MRGALLAIIALGACNLLTGVNDLTKVDDAVVVDASAAPEADTIEDAGADALSREAEPGTDATPEAAPPDAPTDTCADPAPTTRLGVAEDRGAYVNLTPLTVGTAGGLASTTEVPLDQFVVTFDFAILAHLSSIGPTPAAGLAFFAIAAQAKDLPCAPGPHICVLGAKPGFAVLVRTGRSMATDPAPPYIAVVDAMAFPGTQPMNPLHVPAAVVEYEVGNTAESAPPPAAAWRTMTIRAKAGKLDVAIDGAAVLSGVAIPGYAPGSMVTWGMAASTGDTAGVTRNMVRNINLNVCAP